MISPTDKTQAYLNLQAALDSSEHREFSPRAKRWMVISIVGALLLISALFVRCQCSKTHAKSAKADTSMSKMIPDSELRPQLLASFAKDDGKPDARKLPLKKDPQPRETIPTTVAPAGSMAIFVSDGSGGLGGGLGVPMGSELNAVIEQSIMAGGSATPIIAKLTSDFVKDGRVILPHGSRVFGQTMGNAENQMQLRFSRIVFPNGKDHAFSGIAAVAGSLKGKHGGRALSILSGAAIGSAGVFVPGGSGYGDVFARNASQAAAGDVGRDISYYRNTDATPIVSVRSNKKITIMVDRPL